MEVYYYRCSCVVPNRNKTGKQTTPESQSIVYDNLWWCYFIWACLSLLTDLSPQCLIFIIYEYMVTCFGQNLVSFRPVNYTKK